MDRWVGTRQAYGSGSWPSQQAFHRRRGLGEDPWQGRCRENYRKVGSDSQEPLASHCCRMLEGVVVALEPEFVWLAREVNPAQCPGRTNGKKFAQSHCEVDDEYCCGGGGCCCCP